jgi:TrmH family RNA methyltransferase
MTPDVITSLQNPRVQAARKLKRRPLRRSEGAFLVEGPTVLDEALRSGAVVTEIFVDEEATGLGELELAARSRGVPVWGVTQSVLKAITDTTTPQGVAAIVELPDVSLAVLPEEPDLVLLLISVRDPGNAGTLIRSAVAAGAGAVIFAEDSVDPFGPKTVRSTSGMVFHIPLITDVGLAEAAAALRERGVRILGAEAGAPLAHHDVDLSGPVAVAVGNEAWGVPAHLREHLDEVVSIAMPGPAESLNVGVAGSLLLFEAVRQRRPR